MEKNLKLYIYNGVGENISPTPFPDNKEQVEITSFDYNAKRMGDAPSINATFMYPSCLDNEWSENVYVEFNGEKYFLHHTPTSSKSNTDARYKYDVVFVSERRALNDVYLFDVVSADAKDTVVTNSTRFEFYGTIWDLAQRINQSLENSKVNYRVNIPTDKEVVGYITNDYKAISFSDTYVANALQEFYNTFEVPYYFEGREIHLGNKGGATLTETFEYGAKNALLSISKNNANYKIVNRITGTGSSENIPYYYPNTSPNGFTDFYVNDIKDDKYVTVVDNEKFNAKFRLSTKLKYINKSNTHTRQKSSVYAIYNQYTHEFAEKIKIDNAWFLKYQMLAQDGTLPSVEINGSDTSEYFITVKLSPVATILVTQEKLTLEKAISVKLASGYGGETQPDIVQDFTKVAHIVGVDENGNNVVINEGHLTAISNGIYFVDLRITSLQGTHYYDAFFEEGIAQVVNIVGRDKTIGWFVDGIKTSLDAYGIAYSGELVDGTIIGIKQNEDYGKKLPNSTTLMPSIYRKSGGAERFYSAIDASEIEEIEYDVKDAYIDPSKENGEYYTFSNLYNGVNPKEHTINFEDIKPSIKEMTYNGQRIDVFNDIAFDIDDNNEKVLKEEGSNEYVFKHLYFYIKLHKLGFNLFDRALPQGNMTINVTSGHCAGCAFEIAVDDKLKRNKVQVNDKGELMYDKNGNVLLGNPQDKQNNTIDNEVWIAVKKDSTSFTTESDEFVYPNHSKNIEPKTGDTFVITNILLPNEYIEAAEKRLDEELLAYMWQNNSEKFTFSIKFSRIYLAEHPDVLQKLSENATVKIKYNNITYSLYVSSFTYKMKNSEALPEIDVELTDTLTISQNALQNALNEIKMSVISIGQANVLKTGNKYFTRKDIDDTAQGKITFSKGVNIGSHDVVEVNTRKEALDVNYENNVSDTAIPTSAAMIEHGNKCYLSKEKNDVARGNITFLDGMNIGSYTSNTGGGSIDKDGNAELQSLKLRESLIVPEIKYNRATVFKGIQYLTFGGGVIDYVDYKNNTFTLKLEEGEPVSVKAGDLCVGYWHFIDGVDNAENNSDDHKGNFNIAGFHTIYFKVEKVENGVIKYSHRTNANGSIYSTVHPQKGLNFACIANTNTTEEYADRHACKITTTDYEIRLQNLHNWEYSSDNIYRIEGKLDDFSMTAVNDGIRYEQKFKGHGVVFGNAYMYGTLQQFDREVWRISLSYENDNILSGNKKLTAKVYRNDVEATKGTSAGQVKEWIIIRNDTTLIDNINWNKEAKSRFSSGTITLSDADIPEGNNDVKFIIKATVLSTGKDAEGKNEKRLEQSVTFHRLKQGVEGNGIVKVEEFYLVSEKSTDIAIAGNTWYPTPPLTTKDKPYLWNYEKITYTKSGSTTTDPAVIGKHGDDGRGIKSITEWYLVSASDSGVTTATSGWVKTPPKTDPVKKYLWNYEVVTYTDGVEEETTPAVIGTYGDKGEDGNDGKDAVQPNYMDGTSVDGTVERNEWKVNTHNIEANPYRIGEGIFDGKNIMTLQPSMFGRKVRISYTAQGYVDNYSLKNNENYIVLSATFKVPWVKGIAQTTADYKKLHAYIGNIIINGKPLNSPVMEIDKVGSKQITAITPQYKIDNANWGTIPTSIANGETLYARIRITVGSEYLDSEGVEVYDNSTGSRVYISEEDVANVSVYSTVSYNSESNVDIVAGETPAISSWVGHHFFNDDEKNNNIYHKFKFGWTPPSNMTDLAMKFRIGAMYSTKERYMTFSEVKAELYDEKRKENTAYIPSENDKARATNVNLLDGTRNGKNSEGKEIWGIAEGIKGATGSISFGDNLFTFTSNVLDVSLTNCLMLKSPTLKLSGNYTLSFDAKMSNCRAARWLTYKGTGEQNFYETDWMEMSNDWKTHRILLARYNGDFHFRFDSMLSVAAGTTSHLYIRNIKLEEGCFGTAWTISENDKGGKPGFTYRPCGTYDKTVLYVANNEVRDAVYYKDDKGNTGYYICRVSNQGKTPPENPTLWEKSSYIKFLSVEALFADNLFANAIQSGSGYFDGLNAKEVKISGELNATKGTFHDVVINGAYNKLFQTVTKDTFDSFFHKEGSKYYPLLHSWGDAIRINRDDIEALNVYLPSLVPEMNNSYNLSVRDWAGYKRDATGKISKMEMDDVRSLIGRQFIIYMTDTNSALNFKSNAIYRRPQLTTMEFNTLTPYASDINFWNVNGFGGMMDAAVGTNGNMVLILELRVGYRCFTGAKNNKFHYEMLYWDATTINTLDNLIV